MGHCARNRYLCSDIFIRARTDEGKADEKHVGLGVGEGSQTIVIILTGRIPETQVDGLSIDHHISRIIIKAAVGDKTA